MRNSIGEAFNPNSTSFFKDPQRMEKLQAAREGLEQAKTGNHEKLEKLKSQQRLEKNKELGPAIQQAEATKAKLEQAESNLQQTEAKVKEMQQSAPGKHKSVAREGSALHKELKGMEGPGGRNLASQTDAAYNGVEKGTQELERLQSQRDRKNQTPTMQKFYDKKIAETQQKVEKAQQQLDKLKNNSEYGDKIQRYTQLRDDYTATKPDNVRASADSQMSQARNQLSEARQANQTAQQGLQDAEQKFAEGRGAEQAQELKQAQNELTQNLEKQVNDLSTIQREDLSDGITQSRAFGRRSGGDFQARMDGDQLKINNDGRDVTVNRSDDGFNISSAGDRSTTDSRMVRDGDGSWREARTDGSTWKSEQDRLNGAKPYSTSSTERFEDGSSVSKSHREYTDQHLGPVVQDSVSSTSANGVKESSSHTDYRDATVDTHNVRNPDGTGSHSRTYANKDGSYWKDESTVDRGKEGKVETERTYHEKSRQKGVHGIGWFPGRSPEELRGALGDNPRYGEITEQTKTTGPDGKTEYGGNKTHRWSSQNGENFLDFNKGQHGMPDTYTFNRPGMSQTFYRGTNDTSITTQGTDADGFNVTKTREDMRETAAAVKEATDGRVDLDVGGETTIREKEDATVKDLEKLLDGSYGLDRMQQSDAYKEFLQHMDGGNFDLASRQSMTSKDPGKQDEGELYDAAKERHRNAEQIMAVAPDGSRLVMNYDSDTGNRVAQFVRPEDGGQDYSALSMMSQRGNRLEFNSDGEASHITANGVRSALKDADLAGASSLKAPRYGVEAGQKIRSLTAAGKSDPGDFLKGLQKLDGKYGDTFARGFDGVASLLSSANAYADASQGNWGKAARSYASALNDMGGVATGAATGTKSATGRFGQLMKVKNANNLTKIGNLGRFLGVAGAVANAGFAINDFANGDHWRGGLGMAAAGGSALGMLWGGAGWTGPVGWGIAAAASAGILAVDYIDANSIAEPHPALLRAS